MGRIGLIAAVMLTIPACDSAREAAPAATPEGAGAPAAAAVQETIECYNQVVGYSVDYPADWHVNPGEVLPACSVFDPQPVTIPVGTEMPTEFAVVITRDRVPFDTVTAEGPFRDDLLREPVEVDGRPALRVEGLSTGEGLHDRGLRSYQYFVDLGESTLVATTYDSGTLAFERKREVLDRMMESLVLGAQ